MVPHGNYRKDRRGKLNPNYTVEITLLCDADVDIEIVNDTYLM